MAVAVFQELAPTLLPIACRFEPNWFFFFLNFLVFVTDRSEAFDAQSSRLMLSGFFSLALGDFASPKSEFSLLFTQI